MFLAYGSAPGLGGSRVVFCFDFDFVISYLVRSEYLGGIRVVSSSS